MCVFISESEFEFTSLKSTHAGIFSLKLEEKFTQGIYESIIWYNRRCSKQVLGGRGENEVRSFVVAVKKLNSQHHLGEGKSFDGLIMP